MQIKQVIREEGNIKSEELDEEDVKQRDANLKN
jgi:hypothetical protein